MATAVVVAQISLEPTSRPITRCYASLIYSLAIRLTHSGSVDMIIRISVSK